MSQQELLYNIALTRMTGFNFQTALQLFRLLGGGQAVYEQRRSLAEVLPECSPRLVAALQEWDEPLRRAEAELDFMASHGIEALVLGDERYPLRLAECPDAPIVLYYRGSASLNGPRVVSVVGTRHVTPYGQDLIRRLVAQLRQLCPEVLVVSGLAYGVDVCAHRNALQQGLPTVGVLAHGLDDLYPAAHRDTARQMLAQGGLLTEYVSGTRADKVNFVRRNRIVAGLSDATILVESAARGGGLITTRIAQDYGRSVFAFPGPVGAPYSEGCNDLIRSNGAGLITSAADVVEAMGWQYDGERAEVAKKGIERELFPQLSAEEQLVVDLLARQNDLQQNVIAVRTNIPIAQLTAILFQLEMKGVVKPYAGGSYHLLG